jgi:hypothetical protein
MRRARFAASAAVIAALASSWFAAAASAGDLEPAESWGEVQAQINDQLSDTTGGVQTDSRTISYNDGDVQVVWPTPSQAVAADASDILDLVPEPAVPVGTFGDYYGCPSGDRWYCFYEFRKFKGRRLQFRDCSQKGKTQWLTDWGFSGATSSWINLSSSVVNVFDYESYLWTEGANTKQKWVGSANDHRARKFTAYC